MGRDRRPSTEAAGGAGRGVLPRGWADLGRQLAIWFGFLLAYQLARSLAAGDPAVALENGRRLIAFERQVTGLVELSVQGVLDFSQLLKDIASFSYWNAQFTVVGLALLWVYLRRHAAFTRLRNTILLANSLGLLGFVLLPTAPPRMFPSLGFVDTLASFGALNHGSGLIQLAANPYAAMPSLHSADALIVGVVLASVCRRRLAKLVWALWPGWVWFVVIATGNHFWVDVLAGAGLALLALGIVYRREAAALLAARR